MLKLIAGGGLFLFGVGFGFHSMLTGSHPFYIAVAEGVAVPISGIAAVLLSIAGALMMYGGSRERKRSGKTPERPR